MRRLGLTLAATTIAIALTGCGKSSTGSPGAAPDQAAAPAAPAPS
ncbi:MAG: hypothetical protein JWQ29_1395, partial [Phenylobacterium sp.]|nr:hypothetical protein [Phenylobacterium sp.]